MSRKGAELLSSGFDFAEQKLYAKAIANWVEAARLFWQNNENGDAGFAYHLAGNLYVEIAQDSLHPVPEDSLIPKTRQEILKKALYYYKHAAYQYMLRNRKSNTIVPTKRQIKLLKDQSDASYLMGDYYSGKEFRQEYDKFNGNLAIIDSSVRIAASELESGYRRRQDSLNYESEKKRLLYEKEAQLSALKYEFDKKQALARSESERQQLSLEEAVKRRQIESAFTRKQEEDSARREVEKEKQQSQVRLLKQ